MLLIGTATHTRAQSTKITPNLYLDTQFAFATSKSKLIESNDTGTALRYGIGSYAGSDGQIGFHLLYDLQTTAFGLNRSSLSMAWQDTSLRYHLGPFYLGPLFTRLELKCNRAGTDIIDAAGSGYGANVGLLFAVGRDGTLRLDVATAAVSAMKNSLEQDVSISQRLDADLGASIKLTGRLLDLVFGYRVRNLSIKSDRTYVDSIYQTYSGLRLSLYF
jgi:hypothetical protein